ncbi:MAG: DUF4445 domain-containing protein [Candidatus Tectomicrobia bacterium]|uniref:DUF4445 domain-containing protein n=1 Tax=Tectimicrobiota bacterium TaxID=2528274 RepID=A0A933LQ36_UNCTE|nr:DUF4445 domain-containing protein [Candidatus Tectomicrobia bacterium]
MKFMPDGIETKIGAEETLLEAAQRAGLYINSICGGDGLCGKCRLIVREGQIKEKPTTLLERDDILKGYILACETTVFGDVVVEIPPESRLEGGQIVIDEDTQRFTRFVGKKEIYGFKPLARKVYLKSPPPTLQDNISDLERLDREIRKQDNFPILQMGLHCIRRVSKVLRNGHWQITATLGVRGGTTEVIQLEEGDTQIHNYGVAVDIGTTTVVAHLLDLNNGKTVDAQAMYNSQVRYGEDVINRIIYATQDNHLEELHQVIVNDINSLITAMVGNTGIKLHDITAVLCAGNTTMTHLLMGLDPTYIRLEPYTPLANILPPVRAAEIGIKINNRGLLYCLPSVGSYVGGDITAGVLASGIADSPDLAMLIDVGTNGELVIGNRDWLVCCAASAGPAFEGGGVKHGMKATHGAIERVSIDPDRCEVHWETVGNTKPRGICGSGLLDCLAEMLKMGCIDRAGKFTMPDHNDRLRNGDLGPEFVLVPAKDTAMGEDIIITQVDIANLIRAKGAIYAGASILIKSMGYSFSDLTNLFISGGFGNYLNIDKAITIGLLPDIDREKIKFIGNSSINGAKMALISQEALNRVDEIAGMMTYFELSVHKDFMDEFVSANFLPHTDINAFPSVEKALKLT